MGRSETVFERLAGSLPVDGVARRVTSPGYRHTPHLEDQGYDSEMPLPMIPFPGLPDRDLVGQRVGRLTVIGYSSEVRDRWVLRCCCGKYTLRRRRSITLRGDANVIACTECRHHMKLRSRERSKIAGKEFSHTSDTPLPTMPFSGKAEHDLTELIGRQIGGVTIIGFARDVRGRWVVQCRCGAYTLRRLRVLRGGEPGVCERCNKVSHEAYLAGADTKTGDGGLAR